LLLDEPLASLDQARKKEIFPWIERLHTELKIPVLYVTHSSDELARLADHLLLLDGGLVKACGPATEVMAQTEFAIASGNEAGVLLHGSIAERDSQYHLARVETAGGSFWTRDQGHALGKSVRLRIMAKDVSLAISEPQGGSIQNRLPGTIQSIHDETHPSQALLKVRCGEALILSRVTQRSLAELRLQPGSSVWCLVKAAALID
jgi:molybdate transport system ATP-binding protein